MRGLLYFVALLLVVPFQLSERTRPWAHKQIENIKRKADPEHYE